MVSTESKVLSGSEGKRGPEEWNKDVRGGSTVHRGGRVTTEPSVTARAKQRQKTTLVPCLSSPLKGPPAGSPRTVVD